MAHTFTLPFRKIKVQRQLSLIFLTAVFIPVIIIGNYLIYNSRSLLLKHYNDLAKADNYQARSIIYDITSSIYSKAKLLDSDNELKVLLQTFYPSDKEAQRALNKYEGFSVGLTNDAYIHSLDIYTFNQTLPNGTYIHPIDDDIRNTVWFKKISVSVTPFWTAGTSTDSLKHQSSTLCLYTRIFLPQIKNYAILKLTLDKNQLSSRLSNCTQNTVIWLKGEKPFFASHNQTQKLSRLPDIKAGSYCLGSIYAEGKKSIGCISSLLTGYSTDNFYIASVNTDGYTYINDITALYTAILLFILASTSIFVLIYSRYFARRVSDLRETMHNVSNGHYNSIHDSQEGKDEISEAFRDLDHMVQNIIQKEASVYKAELKNKELMNQQAQMRFEMLSSQINPHFLYNTLETIRMRALAGGNREVANAVKLLGKTMRYALDNSTTSITSLYDELEQIDAYLSIQKLRFHDKFNYTLKTPFQMNTKRYQIMPFLIQPIVENAVLHGLHEVEENGHLIIHIIEQNKTLYIKIFDNGCGMTPEELEAMKENIYSHPKDSSKSIGIYNVYQRIKLRYGSEYGIEVRSKKNCGTLFTISIPAIEYMGGGTKR